jgi:hypothetical protein
VARTFSLALTFTAVVVAWVFFRAANVRTALYILKGMLGLNGVSLPVAFSGKAWLGWFPSRFAVFDGLLTNTRSSAAHAVLWIALLLLIAWMLPNTQQLTRYFHPGYESIHAPTVLPSLTWRPSHRWAMLTGIVLALGVLSLNRVSAFLYFQF